MTTHLALLRPQNAGIALFALFAMQICVSDASANSPRKAGSECEKDILSLVQRATFHPEQNLQGELNPEFWGFSFDKPGCKSRRVVHALANLLKNKDDVIREDAAEALANIGPPAKSAVPALEQALRESDAQIADYFSKAGGGFLPTSYSGQSIRRALRNITGRKIPEYNEDD